MENFIIIAIVVVIIGLASWYIIKAKKSGKKCIGCPENSCCNNKNKSNCNCNCK